MAIADIRAMLRQKQEKNETTKLALKDIHRDLIVALTAITIYGKEARDEEILSIIINGTAPEAKKTPTYLERITESFNARMAKKEIKKVNGEYRDANGFLVLVPAKKGR